MNDDFLDDDVAGATREDNRQKAIEFARMYLVFETDPLAAKLLTHWDTTLMRKRIAVNAPHTEYAATEAVRTFIAAIHEQIELAKTGTTLDPT